MEAMQRKAKIDKGGPSQAKSEEFRVGTKVSVTDNQRITEFSVKWGQ